jgi:hypothetical protein
VHGDLCRPPRDQDERDRGERGQQDAYEQQSVATIVVAIPTDSPHHVHETSSGSPGAVRSAL